MRPHKHMPHIWVIEMLCEYVIGYKWGPTVGCKLSKEEGMKELRSWKQRNPHTKFRLRKYNGT
mgnify:CR=1 FL=1